MKGLASTILARSARQLPQDWRQHYGYTPLLLETLVDGSRFNGTCYRAANWISWETPPAETEPIAFNTPRPVRRNLSLFFPFIGALSDASA